MAGDGSAAAAVGTTFDVEDGLSSGGGAICLLAFPFLFSSRVLTFSSLLGWQTTG